MLLSTCVSLFGVANVQAAYVNEVEANNSLAAAQNLDSLFDLAFDANIGDKVENTSTKYKHASVIAANNDSSFDYFSFTVLPGTTKVILDLDETSWTNAIALDPMMFLFRVSTDKLIAQNDNAAAITDGAAGSTRVQDPYLEATGLVSGEVYVVAISRQFSIALGGPPAHVAGSATKAGDRYTLHVTQVPEPGSLMLVGLVSMGLVAYRQRFRRK